jgi:hypothetical protein
MSCKNCSDVTLLSGNDGNGIQTIVDNGDGTFTIFMTNGTTFTSANLTGSAATVTAGTATGLAEGAAPTVANSGTTSAAVFNFGIPVGATGAQGPQGFGLLIQRTISVSGNLGLAAINKLTTIGNVAAAITVTIRPNATTNFDDGQTFILQKIGTDASVITIQADAGVTLNNVAAGSFVFSTAAGSSYNSGAMLIQGTTDNWFIIKMS